ALGEGDDVVALGLDAAEDLPAQAALDGVGLEQDECALCGHSTRVPTDPGRSGTAGGTRCGAAALAPAPAGAGCAAGRSGRGLLRAARAEHLGVHRILLPVQLVALEHAVGVE